MKKLFAIIISFGLIVSPLPIVSNAHAGGGGMAKQVLGISNGVMGAAILTKCKLGATQPSILVYMGGGIAYVLSEMFGGKQKSQDIDKQGKDLEKFKEGMVEGGDYQKESIQAQIDNEKSNLAFVQKRRKWMMAIKVIYLAATALAALELILKAPPILKPDIGACSPNEAGHQGFLAMLSGAYMFTSSFGGGMMNAAIGAAAGKFLLRTKVATSIADKAVGILNTSTGRLAFFAGTTALVFMVDGELKSEENDIKKRIADLEKVKSSLPGTSNALAEGDGNGATDSGAAGGELNSANDPSSRAYALRGLEGQEMNRTCFSNVNNNPEFSSDACKKSYKLTRPTFDAKFDIPALRATSNKGSDFTQALVDGDLAKADVLAGELASQAGRMNKIKDELMAKANEKLKADGKKPIDVDGEIKRQVAALEAGLNKQNLGFGQSALANINAGEAATSDIKDGEDANAGNINTASVPAAGAIGAGDGIDLSGIGAGEDGLLNGETAADPTASLEDSLSEFESAENDISKTPDVSIFKQVSNRYFLNYTKIFDKKKKIDPPLAQPEPANP